jgi:hypothetical protein
MNKTLERSQQRGMAHGSSMELCSVSSEISDEDAPVQSLLQATGSKDQGRHHFRRGLLKSSMGKKTVPPVDDEPDQPDPLDPGHQYLAQLGGVEETHRGINIQRPWAELILRGIKKIEARVYPLKSFKEEVLWIIQTPGKGELCTKTREELDQVLYCNESLPSRVTGVPPSKEEVNPSQEAVNNAPEDSPMAALPTDTAAAFRTATGCSQKPAAKPRRPYRRGAECQTKLKAKIVGIVKFIQSKEYKTYEEWRDDADRHRVPKNSEFDWQSGKMFGWEIGEVKRLVKPQLAPKKKGNISSKATTRMALYE